MYKHDFPKNLIKGKIAEMVFEQMFREAGGYTILGFGYEKILPELAHMQQTMQAQKTMEVIRRAPDFAVIRHEKEDKESKVYLVEVKFMRTMTSDKVLDAASKMFASWNPSYLFVATPDGFFVGSAKTIIEQSGHIEPLDSDKVSQELQTRYTDLLNSFID